MKMTDAEIREQMKTQVWVRAESKDDYKKILIYLEENGIEGPGQNLNPDNVPEPSSEPGRRYPYWPIAIDYANKKARVVIGTLSCAGYSSSREVITVNRFFRILEGKKPAKESEIEKIYFDMDGVLADFAKGVREICGIEPPLQPQDLKEEERMAQKVLDDQMWELIREAGNFYYQLELMPNARELFDAVYEIYGERCEILTGVPKEKRGITSAGKDKEEWVHDFLSKKIKVNIVHREEKIKKCHNKGCVLIDDMALNITEWENAGGTGIRNLDAVSTTEKLKEMGIL